MVDSENQTEVEFIKTLIYNLQNMNKHLNFDIEKLMQYIEPVLVFKEKMED